MFERWGKRAIEMIILGLLVAAIALAIWNAIPGFIKIIAAIAIICGFIKMLK